MASYWDILIPEATTNLITNPSFETGTTGWATSGTNTIAAGTAQQQYGAQSCLCTYQDNTTLAYFNITLTAAAHAFSCWVRIPSNWDGGAIRLALTSFTSVVTDTATTTTSTADGVWRRIEILFTPDAGDLTGNLLVETASAPTAGRNIRIDGAQCEALGYTTTYCDGDLRGCSWNGTAHASTSTRDALEGSGGRVRNFADDLSFHVATERGTGMPSIDNLTSALALQPGSLLEGQSIAERVMTLNGSIIGTSVTDFHDKKRTLIRALNANAATIADRIQPRTLRYTGATVDKEIRAVYDAGLEDGLPMGWAEVSFDLRLLAADPMYYQIGESAAALDSQDSATFSYVAAKESGAWGAMGNPAASVGLAGPEILCSARYNDTIYFGGDFTNFDSIANADYIVQYSISGGTYSALSTGVSSVVWDMVVDGDGTLYIVGAFTNAGGDADADHIAQWNGSAFSAVGDPVTGATLGNRQYKCTIDTNGNFWVGGEGLNFAGIANADYIAYWDGANWNAAGTGMNDHVRGLKPDNKGGVYATGDFTTSGGTTTNGVAYWNGSAWSALSTGLEQTWKVSSIAVDASNNVYVGDTATDNTASAKIAKWNGSAWEGLGAGLSGGTAYDMKLAPSGDLYLAGDFTSADGVTLNGAAIWNGSTFAPLEVNLPGSAIIEAFELLPNGDIYFGYDTTGTATYAGSTDVSYSGTARAYPVIKIKRSGGTTASLVAITNWTTRSSLYFNAYAILDGEELTIDTRPAQQSITSTFSGNRQDALLRNSFLGDFYLIPSNTDGDQINKITAFIDTTGAPTITMNMIYRDTYASQD